MELTLWLVPRGDGKALRAAAREAFAARLRTVLARVAALWLATGLLIALNTRRPKLRR